MASIPVKFSDVIERYAFYFPFHIHFAQEMLVKEVIPQKNIIIK